MVDLRKGFIARPGCVLVSADYAQVELRILAHLSNDTALIEAFCGPDLFRGMAAKLFRVPLTAVTDTMRQRVKAVTYATLYGCGIKKLVEDMEVPEDAALKYMTAMRDAYPQVYRHLDEIKRKCRRLGYIETISGRRRYLPAIKAADIKERRGAERQAINSTVQGSAADLIKQAMIDIDGTLNPLHAPTHGGGANIGRLLLQIHDELIFEVIESEAPQLRAKVRKAMEGVTYGGKLRVPLSVQIKQGPSWGCLSVVDEEGVRT